MSLSGKQIGNYDVGQEIGSGGMGEIYQVHERGKHRPLAMKTLRSDHKDEPDMRQRFIREIRLMCDLKHPNIISILDWGYKDSVLFFTMEMVKGTSLKDMLKEKRFTPHEARDLLTQAANALCHAHSKGIMHRDIKPGNFFVEQHKHGTHVYLGDFGLAKNPWKNRDLPKVRRTHGSIQYLAPEVQDYDMDFRTDVYGLAAIAYEMLLGVKPDKEELRYEDGQIIPVKPPSDICATFPEPLEKVLVKGLHEDKEQRYQTVEKFIHDFERAMEDLTERQRNTSYVPD
jgi:serine/threonine-protein kinase